MSRIGEPNDQDLPQNRPRFAFAPTILGTLLANPLTRNGYALVASFAITSILGVVFWIVAARLYPQDQVGIGGVIVTTMITLSSASQLGFGNWLNRELPGAGANRKQLIRVAYVAGVCTSLLLASGFLLAAPSIAPDVARALGTPWLTLWFALAVAGWTLFALQDSVLAGLKLSVWVPAENATYALTKLALLPVLAVVTLSGLALFAAWTLPVILLIIAVNVPVFRRVIQVPAGETAQPLDVRRMVRLIGWDYAAGLALTAALGIAPILVLNASGPTGSASYHLSWTITYALYLIGRSMGISLLTEGVSSPRRLRALTADALIHTMVPMAGAAAVIALGAPFIMRLFGDNYVAQGSTVLRILALASIPWGCLTIRLALARVQGQMPLIFFIQLATLVLVVGSGAWLVPRLGPTGMALAWLVAHSTVLTALIARYLAQAGLEGAIAFGLDIASAIASNFGRLRRHGRPGAGNDFPEERLAGMLTGLDLPQAAAWRPVQSVASYSDSAVLLLGDAASPNRTPRAVLKYSSSPEGMAALRRCIASTAAVRDEFRDATLDFELPSILASQDEPALVATIETFMPGEDGRAAPALSASALGGAASAIRLVHAKRARSQRLDEDWGNAWIERPIHRVSQTPAVILPPHDKARALARFGAWQSAFWLGRNESLGRCHGDFALDNLIFRAAPDGSTLAGIVDWEGSQPDGPAEFDVCLLIISARMHDQTAQMGSVVRQLLDRPVLDPGERAWAERGSATSWQDPDWVRAMVGLTWLRHVVANLDKSGQYGRNRLWLAQNIDWVLRGFARER
jgi:O-antigen/teichoic acid export membrane protein